MRALAVLLAALVVFTPQAARADEREPQPALRGRGWLTGLGVAFIGAGLASLAVGVSFVLSTSEVSTLSAAYDPPTAAEAFAANELRTRYDASSGAAVGFLAAGGLLLVGGVVCAVVDGVLARAPTVAVVPLPSGAGVAFSGQF